jgi:hypothetical protein
MCEHSRLTIRKLVAVFAPLVTLGLVGQAVNAQTISTTPQKTVIRNQSTPNPIHGGPSGAIPPNCSCPTHTYCDGACCAYSTGATFGKSNFVIYNQCNPIKDLHLRFEVTNTLTADHDDLTNNCNPNDITKTLNTTNGIIIQFNAYSKDTPKALIQYIFAVSGTTITPHIQYAGNNPTPDGKDHDWLQSYTNSYGLSLATANSVPPGFVFEVDLGTDNEGYVTSATFTVTEPVPGGKPKKHVQKAPPSGLYKLRISEFQTNVVSGGGHYVDFAKGGAGNLTYSSKDELRVEGGYPHCAAAAGDFSGGTCETSNAIYSGISPCSGATTLTQSVTTSE